MKRLLLLVAVLLIPNVGFALPATDSFTRADNADLGSSWDVMTDEVGFNISGNTAVPSSLASDATESYNAESFPDDQYSQAKITVDGDLTGAGPGVAVRCSAVARTYYRVVISSAGEWELRRFVAGASAALASGTTTYSAGTVLRLEAQGTTLRVYYGGVQLGTDVTDANIASGRAGISYSSEVISASLDDWEGGSLAGSSSTTPSRMLRGYGL